MVSKGISRGSCKSGFLAQMCMPSAASQGRMSYPEKGAGKVGRSVCHPQLLREQNAAVTDVLESFSLTGLADAVLYPYRIP